MRYRVQTYSCFSLEGHMEIALLGSPSTWGPVRGEFYLPSSISGASFSLFLLFFQDGVLYAGMHVVLTFRGPPGSCFLSFEFGVSRGCQVREAGLLCKCSEFSHPRQRC